MSQMALAASKLTISLLWRSQLSSSCIMGRRRVRVLGRQLGRQPDQHHERGRALDGAGRPELLHHLDQRHAVVHAHLV